MKFKSPIAVYCSAYAIIGSVVCGWLFISEGIVFPLALALTFFCLSSLVTYLLMISKTRWGDWIRQGARDYRSGSAGERDIDNDLKIARRVLIGIVVIAAILAVPVFIETGGIIQI